MIVQKQLRGQFTPYCLLFFFLKSSRDCSHQNKSEPHLLRNIPNLGQSTSEWVFLSLFRRSTSFIKIATFPNILSPLAHLLYGCRLKWPLWDRGTEKWTGRMGWGNMWTSFCPILEFFGSSAPRWVRSVCHAPKNSPHVPWNTLGTEHELLSGQVVKWNKMLLLFWTEIFGFLTNGERIRNLDWVLLHGRSRPHPSQQQSNRPYESLRFPYSDVWGAVLHSLHWRPIIGVDPLSFHRLGCC